MNTAKPLSMLRRAAQAACLPLAALLWAAPAAQAQTGQKSVAPEAVPAFAALQQWLLGRERQLSELALVPRQQLVLVAPPAPAAARPFEPHPVILGQPELLLTGSTLAGAARQWGTAPNYQAAHLSLLVADASGRLTLKPLSAAVAVGERFKIRITSTFDAVAGLDQVVGEVWRSQRTGQVYPAPGTSVAIKAGQTVDLPLGADLFFAVDGRTPLERIVVSVRDPRALREAASEQPNYRQDGPGASSFVQLVPAGQFPKIEQLIAVR